MNWSLRKTEKAIDDLADIHAYIAMDNPAAADAVVLGLLSAFDRTMEFPEIGRAADEILPGLRILTRGSYLLLYRLDQQAQSIDLVRVVHGARDWPHLFDA